MSKHKFPWLTCLLVLIFAILAVFGAPVFSGHLLAAEDGRVQNYPAFASSGFLWTPLLLTGFPVMADPQICYFYPIRFLAKELASWNFYVLSGYFLSALFASMFAFRLTKSKLAAIFAGLIYGLGGYQISELRHVQVVQTAAWLPLLLLIVDHLRSPGKWNLWQFCALATASALTILAGHPQTAAYIFLATLAYATLGGEQKLLNRRSILRSVILLAICVSGICFGMAIAAVQLLPSYELSQLSFRATFGYGDFIVGQLEPLQMLGFSMPYLLGGKFGTLEGLPFAEQGPPPGLLFFGLAPLCFVLVAVVRCWQKRTVKFFVILSVVALLFALGSHTPLGQVFYHIPVLSSFRGLYRVLLLPAFAVSVLAAIGLSRIENRIIEAAEAPNLKEELLNHWNARGKWKHPLLCLYFFLSCLVPTFLSGTLPVLLLSSKPRQIWRQALLVVTTVFVLASYATSSQWYRESAVAANFAPPAGTNALREKLKESERIFSLRGLAGDNNEYPPNLSRLWQVASICGYEPLMPRRYMQLLNLSEGGFLQPPWRISSANRAFDISAVRYLYAPKDKFGGRAFVDDAWKYWKLISQNNNVLCYENTRCRPRFYVVQQAIVASPEEILKAITTSKLSGEQKFDPEFMVLVEDQIEPVMSSTKVSETFRSSDAITSVACDSAEDEKIALTVEADRPGYLVVADQYYPGWQATVDGTRVKILKANYVQRAVALEKGSHKIIFSYHPQSYENGKLISLIALLVLSIGVVAGAIIGRS